MKLSFDLDNTGTIRILLSGLNQKQLSEVFANFKQKYPELSHLDSIYVDESTASVCRTYGTGLLELKEFNEVCEAILESNYIARSECEPIKLEYLRFKKGFDEIIKVLRTRSDILKKFHSDLFSCYTIFNLEKSITSDLDDKRKIYEIEFKKYNDLDGIIKDKASFPDKKFISSEKNVKELLGEINNYINLLGELFKNFETIKLTSSLFIELPEGERLPWIMQNLEPCCDAGLMRNLFLEEKNSIISLRLPLENLDLKLKPGSNNSKTEKIFSIKLIASMPDNVIAAFCSSNKHVVFELKMEDGKKYFCLSSRFELDFRLLVRQFMCYPGVKVEEASGYIKPFFPFLMNENYFGNGLRIYNGTTVKHYERIHQAISERLDDIVKDFKGLIRIYFMGCGMGNEISACLEKPSGKHYEIIGVDLEKTNIEIAEKKFLNNKNIKFVTMDVSKFVMSISFPSPRKTISFFGRKKPELRIMIASGFFTRKVQPDTQSAFSIFRVIMRLFDYAILAGENNNVIFRRDAKRLGLEIQQKPIKMDKGDLRFVSVYKKVDLEENKLTKYFMAGDIIDLKEHINPIPVLEKLWNHKKSLTIYLQGVLMGQDEIHTLLKLISNHESHLKIVITGEETWYLEHKGKFQLHNVQIEFNELKYNKLVFATDGLDGGVTEDEIMIERPKVSSATRRRVEARIKEIDQLPQVKPQL